MKKLLISILSTFLLFSCNEHKRTSTVKVETYKVHNPNATSADNMWLYYYILLSPRGGGYYYYTSSTLYTTVPDGATWTSSTTSPISETIENQIETSIPVAEEQQELTTLPDEIEVDMETEPTETSPNESEGSESSGESSGDGGDSGGGGDGD